MSKRYECARDFPEIMRLNALGLARQGQMDQANRLLGEAMQLAQAQGNVIWYQKADDALQVATGQKLVDRRARGWSGVVGGELEALPNRRSLAS